MNRWWGFPPGFMMIFPLLVVIILLWSILKDPERKEFPIYRTETAMDILKKSYARGEITKEEFLEMKNDLEEYKPSFLEESNGNTGSFAILISRIITKGKGKLTKWIKKKD